MNVGQAKKAWKKRRDPRAQAKLRRRYIRWFRHWNMTRTISDAEVDAFREVIARGFLDAFERAGAHGFVEMFRR